MASKKPSTKKIPMENNNSDWHANSGAELLKTGLFSDVTVRCGDKTWKLHKAILCSRSIFFQKALTGDWKEAKLGQITIYEQDPEHVEWIINLIYNEEVPHQIQSLADDDRTAVPTCVALFATADYLGVDRGVSLATALLNGALGRRSKAIQSSYDYEKEDFDKPRYGSPESIQAFFENIAVSYESPSPTFQPLRDAFVDFFRQTQYSIVRHLRYREGLFKIPELARDVLLKLVPGQDRHPHSSQVLFMPPTKCRACKRDVKSGATTPSWYSDIWISEGPRQTSPRVLEGICGECKEKLQKPRGQGISQEEIVGPFSPY